MTPRQSQFNNDELQIDTVENANRPILQYAEDYVNAKTEIRVPLTNGMEYVKTNFRTQESFDVTNGEPGEALKPVFAYPGTDKGVNN